MSNTSWELISSWMKPLEAEIWKLKLYKFLDWGQPKVNVYGKTYLVPRKTIFIADKGIQYRYSGFSHKSNGWPDWFIPLLHKVSAASRCNFNGCLINLYRDGNDRMGWHSDNEKELNPSKPITSLSLGTSRDFLLKNKFSSKKDKILLKDGDLLIMSPFFQDDWVHCIPVRKKIIDYRINLTFRVYSPAP